MIRIEAVIVVLALMLLAVLWILYMDHYSKKQFSRDSKQYLPWQLKKSAVLMDDFSFQLVEVGNDGNNEVPFNKACDKIRILDSVRITL